MNTSVMNTNETNTTKANPVGRVIQGLLSGLFLGLGFALMLIAYAKIAAGTKAPWVVMGIVALVGALLGLLPTRSTKS